MSKPKTREELLRLLDAMHEYCITGNWDSETEQAYNQIKALIQSQLEITMKDIRGWADEIRERVTNHGDWGYAVDTIKDMVEEEFGIKVKK